MPSEAEDLRRLSQTPIIPTEIANAMWRISQRLDARDEKLLGVERELRGLKIIMHDEKLTVFANEMDHYADTITEAIGSADAASK